MAWLLLPFVRAGASSSKQLFEMGVHLTVSERNPTSWPRSGFLQKDWEVRSRSVPLQYRSLFNYWEGGGEYEGHLCGMHVWYTEVVHQSPIPVEEQLCNSSIYIQRVWTVSATICCIRFVSG